MQGFSGRIFSLETETEFNRSALDLFNFQARNLPVYKEYLEKLNIKPPEIKQPEQIPFLPVRFFKSRKLITESRKAEIVFTSSGTTGSGESRHPVAELDLYKKSFLSSFKYFYGKPEDYVFLALLPDYLEREGSSLVYMVDALIKKSGYPESAFFLHDFRKLKKSLENLEKRKQKSLLIGVSFALLDFFEQNKMQLKHSEIMETGGMKGRRKELIRSELHEILKSASGRKHIHSEYGMTELLSQAYSKAEGLYKCPPQMRVYIRDIYDPFAQAPSGKTGGINIIDLANVYSCAFIETEDLGRKHPDGSFEVLGRFDHSDTRGCNLMVF